jgi:hypothetical protein
MYEDGQETPALADDIDEAGRIWLVRIGHNEAFCHSVRFPKAITVVDISAFFPEHPALNAPRGLAVRRL